MTNLGMSKQMVFTVLVFAVVLILATGCGKAATVPFETSFYRTVSATSAASLQYFANGTYVAAVQPSSGAGFTEQGTYTLKDNMYEMTSSSGATSNCTFTDNGNGTATVDCTNTDITPDHGGDVFKYQQINSVAQ